MQGQEATQLVFQVGGSSDWALKLPDCQYTIPPKQKYEPCLYFNSLQT